MREVGMESVGIGGVAIGLGKPVVCKAKVTSAGVKIWLAVGSAGVLGEDSKLEDMVTKIDMWVGIGGGGPIRVDPVVKATCVGPKR